MPPAGSHALIIEDDMLIALELEHLLADLGFQTFDVADSPTEALTAALSHRPDLVTADYRINHGTGVEAVRAITKAVGPVPVVFVTGNADVAQLETSAPIVDKPVTPRALAAACANAGVH